MSKSEENQASLPSLLPFKLDGAKTDEPHVPSRLQADTLFHFMDKLEWVVEALEKKQLTSRYCIESLEYFNIDGLKKYAIPIKCFCDINLHKMKDHVEWYGKYGIAFSKNWGMHKGIQPVQYINKDSPLCKDIADAFKQIFSSDISEEGSVRSYLEDYLLLQLMYWKPYQGKERKKGATSKSLKCFCDECEWRFIPDLSNSNMPAVITDDDILAGRIFEDYNDALKDIEQASLHFEYGDIKYIILENRNDLKQLLSRIDTWSLNSITRDEILSKVIIWNESKEDF